MNDEIRSFIANCLLLDMSLVINDDDSLFASGMLSLDQFTELAIFLQENYGIEISLSNFLQHRLDTINDLASFILIA